MNEFTISIKEIETLNSDKEWANDTIIESFARDFINKYLEKSGDFKLFKKTL